MTAARYFDLVREMKESIYNHRLRLVESARARGIKPTARLFATTVPTVRKWLRRYQQQGPSGLLARSRARHRQPHKTPPGREAQLLELRKTLPTFGSRRLIREFDLPISHGALERIWRQHGLLKKRRRKYQRKQDLAHIKAQWALFQQISADTKDLDDIPRYWAQAQRLKLPVVQYTAREVRSGLLFWAFAEGRSASRVSSSIWIATASRCAIWSGKPTTAANSKAISQKLSATASMCASRPPRTPIKATSKPSIAWKKMSSLIWKTSPAAVTF
jgi:transposase